MYRRLLIPLFIILPTTSILAQCCCTGYPVRIKNKIDAADLVVVAELIVAKQLNYNSSEHKQKKYDKEIRKYIFKVYTLYKGTISSRIIDLYSYPPSECGEEFIEGETYIIYAVYNDAAALKVPDADGRYYYTESCRFNSRRMDFVIEAIEKVVPAKKRWLKLGYAPYY